jgi:antitoxin component of RelBE/YafQ-DinJ toxin-antitoxin module
MRRSAETVSVRVREQTYTQVKAIAKEQGVKAVDIFDEMLERYVSEPKPLPKVTPGAPTDASHRSLGNYINNQM